MSLENLKRDLELLAFEDANTQPGHCVNCKEAYSEKNVFTEDGWKETKLSRMCEKCFDEAFSEDDSNEED